jgi:hypothetical protein
MNAARPCLLAALPLALASGCALEDRHAANIGVGSRETAVAVAGVGGPRAPAPRDRYIAVRGKRKTLPPPTERQPAAFYQTTPDVFAPFDVSVHFGLFDPRQTATAGGVRACLEIDNVGFTVFFDVCGDYDEAQAGWNLFAFIGLPVTALPGALFVPGPDAEVRIETDGTTLRFHGRAFGSSTWTQVSSTAYPTQTAPLKAALGASRIRKGTVVGFDDPSFVSAAAPGPLTPEQAIAADANAALLAGLQAFLALDGPSPDFTAAAAALDAADAALSDARIGVAVLPEGDARRKADKLLTKASAKLQEAEIEAAAGLADRALKDLGKAADRAEAGILVLVPQPFPSPP